MKFREFNSPRSHVVIDDVFSPEDLTQVWSEVLLLEPLMHIGLPGGDDNRYNDIKRNRNTLITPAARIGAKKNRSTEIVKRTLWSPGMSDALEECREPMFRLLKFCASGDLHFSSYKNGEFYGAHPDFNDPVNLTVVVFLCGTPKKFSGGNFLLFFDGEKKLIPFKNNRAVIFPSNTLHEVTPVLMESRKFRDCRVTLQIWPKLERVSLDGSSGAANKKRSRSKASNNLDAYLLPHFGVSADLWRELANFFQFAKLPKRRSGSFDGLVRAPGVVFSVLASNLKYMGREFFDNKSLSFDSGTFGGDRGELARVSAHFREDGITYSFGYVISRLSNRTLLHLFVRAGEKGKKPLERMREIRSDADYAQTRAAFLRLFRGFAAAFEGSEERLRPLFEVLPRRTSASRRSTA